MYLNQYAEIYEQVHKKEETTTVGRPTPSAPQKPIVISKQSHNGSTEKKEKNGKCCGK